MKGLTPEQIAERNAAAKFPVGTWVLVLSEELHQHFGTFGRVFAMEYKKDWPEGYRCTLYDVEFVSVGRCNDVREANLMLAPPLFALAWYDPELEEPRWRESSLDFGSMGSECGFLCPRCWAKEWVPPRRHATPPACCSECGWSPPTALQRLAEAL